MKSNFFSIAAGAALIVFIFSSLTVVMFLAPGETSYEGRYNDRTDLKVSHEIHEMGFKKTFTENKVMMPAYLSYVLMDKNWDGELGGVGLLSLLGFIILGIVFLFLASKYWVGIILSLALTIYFIVAFISIWNQMIENNYNW